MAVVPLPLNPLGSDKSHIGVQLTRQACIIMPVALPHGQGRWTSRQFSSAFFLPALGGHAAHGRRRILAFQRSNHYIIAPQS